MFGARAGGCRTHAGLPQAPGRVARTGAHGARVSGPAVTPARRTGALSAFGVRTGARRDRACGTTPPSSPALALRAQRRRDYAGLPYVAGGAGRTRSRDWDCRRSLRDGLAWSARAGRSESLRWSSRAPDLGEHELCHTLERPREESPRGRGGRARHAPSGPSKRGWREANGTGGASAGKSSACVIAGGQRVAAMAENTYLVMLRVGTNRTGAALSEC